MYINIIMNSINIENVSKLYRLGVIGRNTLARDVQSYVYKLLGRDDPNSKIHPSMTKKGVLHEKYTGGNIWALKDISLNILEGEILGIIGKNGAGKSTLLKILSRITTPTTGTVKMQGRVASMLEVGTGFHPELTGRENIYLNGAILGMKKQEIEERICNIIDFAEIQEYVDTPVKRYSSGMHVRLAFSVAAHLEPDILVVDEVLAVGDHAFQKKCLGKMGEVSNNGRTVLLVSHNMATIQSLCTKAVVIEKGSIMFYGNPSQAIKRYFDSDTDLLSASYNLENYRNKYRTKLLNRLEIFNNSMSPSYRFAMGESIVFVVTLGNEKPPDALNIELSLDNSNGTRLFTSSTRFTNKILKNENKIYMTVLDEILLPPSIYSVNIRVGDNNSDYDSAEGISAFEIYESDIYGSGKIPTLKEGVVVKDLIWKEIK